MNKQLQINHGFSLVEILVVISIFAVIGILSTRSLFLTLRGAKKSDSLVSVRENINNALSVMERQIRNSEKITCPSSGTTLSYISLEGVSTSFSCTTGTSGYIASGSARLTSEDISIISCSIDCSQSNLNVPPLITISITAEDNTSTSVEKGSITTETKIVGRNY